MKNNKQKSIVALALVVSLGFVAKTVTQGKLGLHYSKEGAGEDLFAPSIKAKDFKSGKLTGEAILKDGSGNPPGLAENEDFAADHEDGLSETEGLDHAGTRGLRTTQGKIAKALVESEGLSESVSSTSISGGQSSGAYGMTDGKGSAKTAKLGELGTMKDGVAGVKNSGEKVQGADGLMAKGGSVAANGANGAMGKTGAPGTASADSLKDASKVSGQDYASAGKNGLVRGGATGEKGDESFPGEKTPPQNVAVSDIRGSVFGPLGLEGDSKPVTDVPGYTKLWQPQNHNPTEGRGKQTQVYQAMAAGQNWTASSQAMKVAVNAQFEYANWATQAHRFGITDVNEAKDPIGARREVGTLNPYDDGRYAANQPPDAAKFQAGAETGFKLVQCSIHPEIAFVMEVVANDLLNRPGNLGPGAGGAHQDAKIELKKLNPFSGLATIFGSIPKLVFAKASK